LWNDETRFGDSGVTAEEAAAADSGERVLHVERSPADRLYRAVALAAGSMTLVIIALIFVFLVVRAWPALREAGIWDFLTTREWRPTDDPPRFGVAALLYGTVLVALIAVTIAVPIAIGAALFINEYAPRPARRAIIGLVDLLAAVPSVVYGVWGFTFLMPAMEGPTRWIATYFDFIPFFRPSSDTPQFTSSIFIAGFVVSFMVLPIVTSVVREVFSQAPRSECEAALALGGTRWGMARTVLLPFGSGGIIGGSMLGLGRALGETIAVALLLTPDFRFVTKILEPGGVTASSYIALNFQNAGAFEVRALLAVGLALFVLTLAVNMAATAVVSRSRSGQGVEL
jgi:phosphate transport system permease protein